ncbi:MAG: hypothetical protein ACLP8A_08005 [Methylovirgula sp.]
MERALPWLAGIALMVFAVVAHYDHHELTLIDVSLAIFGAALVAAPVIAKFKFSASGVEFETNIKDAATKLADVVAQQGEAIKTINENLIKMNESIEALQRAPGELENALTSDLVLPKPGKEWKNIFSTYLTPKTIDIAKTSDIGKALQANNEMIVTATDLSRQVKESLAKLR